jgi:hypothetical protein
MLIEVLFCGLGALIGWGLKTPRREIVYIDRPVFAPPSQPRPLVRPTSASGDLLADHLHLPPYQQAAMAIPDDLVLLLPDAQIEQLENFIAYWMVRQAWDDYERFSLLIDQLRAELAPLKVHSAAIVTAFDKALVEISAALAEVRDEAATAMDKTEKAYG